MSTGENRATDIFGPYGIGPLSLKNRFARSATAESSATPDGVLTEGVCDMISMSRPFIREPDLVNRMAAGQVDRSSCISCGECFRKPGLRCAHVPAALVADRMSLDEYLR